MMGVQAHQCLGLCAFHDLRGDTVFSAHGIIGFVVVPRNLGLLNVRVCMTNKKRKRFRRSVWQNCSRKIALVCWEVGHPLCAYLFKAHTTWTEYGEGLATAAQSQDAIVRTQLAALRCCACLKGHRATADSAIHIGTAMGNCEIKTICA